MLVWFLLAGTQTRFRLCLPVLIRLPIPGNQTRRSNQTGDAMIHQAAYAAGIQKVRLPRPPPYDGQHVDLTLGANASQIPGMLAQNLKSRNGYVQPVLMQGDPDK